MTKNKTKTGTFEKKGIKYEVIIDKFGGFQLWYLGRVDDPIKQACMWPCDTEEELNNMIEALITPGRYADDEWRERHRDRIPL